MGNAHPKSSLDAKYFAIGGLLGAIVVFAAVAAYMHSDLPQYLALTNYKPPEYGLPPETPHTVAQQGGRYRGHNHEDLSESDSRPHAGSHSAHHHYEYGETDVC